ncbi:hypothetical protein FRC17_003285, partial [Serendipita sp. 399]
RRVEQEISYSRIEISYGEDFLLALFHLNHPYGWEQSHSWLATFVPDILLGSPTLSDDTPYGCIDYLTSVCQGISSDPLRLIRLLIELIRADLNYLPDYRRPKTFLGLLAHAKAHLSSSELRSYSPSCRRLTRYIKESYKQFEENWLDYDEYSRVDRVELKKAYEEVVILLNPIEPWDGEETDISWPVHLLRPTGRKDNPFKEDLETEMDSHNVVMDGKEEAGQFGHEEQSAKSEDASVAVQNVPVKEDEKEVESHNSDGDGRRGDEQVIHEDPKKETEVMPVTVPESTNEEK